MAIPWAMFRPEIGARYALRHRRIVNTPCPDGTPGECRAGAIKIIRDVLFSRLNSALPCVCKRRHERYSQG